jgi:hypothetical protein
MQGDDVQSDDVQGGDRMRRARKSHARRAPFILAEAEGRLWHGEPEERRRSESEGPNGFGLARLRMRARVFYRWPTQLISAGACVCKATDHAQASWRSMVWKQNGSGGLANGCASMPAVHAPEQSGKGGFLLVRAEVFGQPCFGIACAWAEEVQPVSRKTLGFAEKSV